MWHEIFFSVTRTLSTTVTVRRGFYGKWNLWSNILFLSSRLQWLSVTPVCMIQSKTAIQFPSFFSGKRHLTVNMSRSLSKQIAVIYWFDTSILHSSGRLGSRCREVETDSAHKTSIRWQIWHPSGEDSDKLTNHYTISVMGSHLVLQ